MTITNYSDDADPELHSTTSGHTVKMSEQRGRGLMVANALVPAVEIAVDNTRVDISLPLRDFGTPA